MAGGVMQLVAYGAQDLYITGNPQITFFKIVYRRHTNFAVESVKQTFTTDADFGKTVTCKIGRNGDLLSRMYLQFDLPALEQSQNSSTWHGYANSIGHIIMEHVSLKIGGQLIEKQYPEWMEIWAELTLNEAQRRVFGNMIGKYESDVSLETNASASKTYYVPLQFWFCRNPGLALPLIALQYHDVEVEIKFRNLNECTKADVALTATPLDTNGDTVAMSEVYLYVDYIYLDNDERRRFAQTPHEYLIDQSQYIGAHDVDDAIASLTYKLGFEQPVKELMWAFTTNANLALNTNTGNNLVKFVNANSTESFTKLRIQFNGQDRFSERNAAYFREVQALEHHKAAPRKYIYTYSFGLKPEEHQPTGCVNFSRLNDARMLFTTATADMDACKLKVFAMNYNVLRVVSGMAGLSF